MIAPALVLLADQAFNFRATATLRTPDSLAVVVEVRRVDAKLVSFDLTIEAIGAKVLVRETVSKNLPASCPERHINSDGSFCMSFSDIDPLNVVDEESAERWWGTLHEFLRQQERAAKRKVWPVGNAWAHGEAASHQHIAEQQAQILGDKWVADIKSGLLRVEHQSRKSRMPDAVIRLYADGQLKYAVWQNRARVIGLRKPCICGARVKRGKGKLISFRACSKHPSALAKMIIALYNKQRSEDAYWASMSTRPCCGTMRDCPLKKALSSSCPNR